MTLNFYKIGEMNGSSHVKILLRSSVILNIGNVEKYCFLWSILAYLLPCNNNQPNRVSNYRQYFNQTIKYSNIEGFHFNNGFKCRDVLHFEKLKFFTN